MRATSQPSVPLRCDVCSLSPKALKAADVSDKGLGEDACLLSSWTRTGWIFGLQSKNYIPKHLRIWIFSPSSGNKVGSEKPSPLRP